MVCTFFGHSDCYELDAAILQRAIEELIVKGVDTFYVGNQGHFDNMVFRCLTELKTVYPHIAISVVLAYLPTTESAYDAYQPYSLYPEGMEIGPPRFAIGKRNQWMIDRANYCLCYINHKQGGAYTFARRAKRKGLTLLNLGSADC